MHDHEEVKEPVRSPFKKGDKIRLKKGCAIKFTTHPKRSKEKDPKVGRATIHTVYRVASGYKGQPPRWPGDTSSLQTTDDEVVWAGANGYWFHSSDFANMELVTE